MNKLTIKEASRNLKEMSQNIGQEHAEIVLAIIEKRAAVELDELFKTYMNELLELTPDNDTTSERQVKELTGMIDDLVNTVDDIILFINGQHISNFI